MASKRHTADLLFWVQIICAGIICSAQFVRLLETTEGQLLSLFVSLEIYLCFHIILALRAHRALPSRVALQALAMYWVWFLLIGTNIVALFINGEYEWSTNDTRTTALVSVGVVTVLVFVTLRSVPLLDPVVMSFLAMTFKVLPQIVMAFEVARVGGAGLPGISIVISVFTLSVRVGLLWLSILEAGWERNRTWLFISEVMNGLSWALVIFVWLIWFLT
jgi:hypothetical protein